jgi:hypothetical protein
MKKLVVLLLVSLMATSAFAVVDPDDNMMGIYFDLEADTLSKDATANVPFMAYLMITNSTYPELSGFEASYRVETPAGMGGLFFRLAEDLQGGLNVSVGNTAVNGEYIVGWPSPRPATPAFVAVSWQLMLLGEFQADIYLGPTSAPSIDNGLPAIEIGGAIRSVGLSTGGAGIPVAVVNGMAPVAEEMESFGNVKALFR